MDGPLALSVPLFRISSISLFLVSFQQITRIEQDSLREYNIDTIFLHLNDFSTIFSNFFVLFCFCFYNLKTVCKTIWALLSNISSLCRFLLVTCPFNSPSLNCSTSSSHMNLILPAVSNIYHNFSW